MRPTLHPPPDALTPSQAQRTIDLQRSLRCGRCLMVGPLPPGSGGPNDYRQFVLPAQEAEREVRRQGASNLWRQTLVLSGVAAGLIVAMVIISFAIRMTG